MQNIESEHIAGTYQEVSLDDLIIAIWNGKWLIVGITLLFLMLGYIYIQLDKVNYSASLQINPISNFDEQKYAKFNLIAKPDTSINFEITASQLFQAFADEFEISQILSKQIENSGLIDQADYSNQESYLDALIKFNSNFTISKKSLKNIPAAENTTPRNEYAQITYKGKNYPEIRQIISTTLNEMNSKVKNYYVTLFESTVTNTLYLKKIESDKVDRQIENLREDYRTQTDNKLAFLREQSAIARELNIEEESFTSISSNEENTIINAASTKSEKSYYLRGFIAIDKEIELIEGRKNPDAFIEQLLSLQIAKRNLEQDNYVELSIAEFNTTPIKTESFMAVRYEVAGMFFKPQLSKFIIMLVSLFFGIIASMLILLIFNVLRTKTTK